LNGEVSVMSWRLGGKLFQRWGSWFSTEHQHNTTRANIDH